MRIAGASIAFALICLLGVPSGAKPFSATYALPHAKVEFSWSKEADAVPQLVRGFRNDIAKEKARTSECGRVFYESFMGGGFVGAKCESSTKITTSGQTRRLLSMARAYWAFTGGAHGNGATRALLWDRQLKKQMAFWTLFSEPGAAEGVLRRPYCAALDGERKKRRGPEYQPSSLVPEFDSCPKLSQLQVLPADSRGNGKFDHIHLMAAPYQAGSFAEGEYDIVLPVTASLIAALEPEYRSSFEVQRQ
jgi:hypothetical protein